MSAPQLAPDRTRFGDFELDLGAGELRKNGARVPLPQQPLLLLEVLVDHPGVVVSREQLRERLWAADTFVDFEHGLNAAVKRLRDALGDSADQPRFIETVPKRGYRFIAPLDGVGVPSPPATTEPGILRFTWRRLLVAAAAVVALATAAGAAWWVASGRRASALAPDLPSRLRRLTFDSGMQIDPTFAPGGRSIAYASNKAGNFDIWMQPVDGGSAVQLTSDPANDTQPAWSPDGRSIVFRSERQGGGVFGLSPADGHVWQISRTGYAPRWSPDGSTILVRSGLFSIGSYYLIGADGASQRAIPGAPTSAVIQLTAAGWHPNGSLVFFNQASFNQARYEISVLALGAHLLKRRAVSTKVQDALRSHGLFIADREPLAFSPDGRILYFVAGSNFSQSRSLWHVVVDPTTLDVLDGPFRVTTGEEWSGTPNVTRAGGALAFGISRKASRIWLFEFGPGGRTLRQQPIALTTPDLNASTPALSPDGRSVVVQVVRPGSQRVELQLISLGDLSRRTLRTADLAARERLFNPRWSPDGASLAYSFRHGEWPLRKSAIRMLDVKTGQEVHLTSDAAYTSADNPWSWTADRRSILASGSRYADGGMALVRLPLPAAPFAERQARVLVSSRDQGLWQAAESPNGRWVCFNSTTLIDMRDSRLFVISATGGVPTPITGPGTWDDKPRWSPDGRLLYFLSTQQDQLALWAVSFDPVSGQTRGAPFRVASFPEDLGVLNVDEAEIGLNGSRLVVALEQRQGSIWVLEHADN